jgi:D-sedoheptulose 7-phosphate isomerase
MNKSYCETLKRNLQRSIAGKEALAQRTDVLERFGSAVAVVVDSYRRGGRLYIAGNGGSAADAQHLAAEFVSKLARDRSPLPAEALTVDSSILAAIGNDYGYEKVFSRQIAGKMRKPDVFLGITTSGKSPNILEAPRSCRELGLADHCINECGDETSSIQAQHIVVAHTLCECVETQLFSG